MKTIAIWLIAVATLGVLIAINLRLEGWPLRYSRPTPFRYAFAFIPPSKSPEEEEQRYAQWHRDVFHEEVPRVFDTTAFIVDCAVALALAGLIPVLGQWKSLRQRPGTPVRPGAGDVGMFDSSSHAK